MKNVFIYDYVEYEECLKFQVSSKILYSSIIGVLNWGTNPRLNMGCNQNLGNMPKIANFYNHQIKEFQRNLKKN